MAVTTRNRKNRGTRATRRVSRRTSGSNSWLWWVGGIALSLVLTLTFKLMNKSKDDQQVKNEMIEMVHGFPNYSENSQYYTDLVNRFHHQAFDASYSMGGRHSAAKLDAKIYLGQISGMMAEQAASDGKAAVAETLKAFNQAVRSTL